MTEPGYLRRALNHLVRWWKTRTVRAMSIFRWLLDAIAGPPRVKYGRGFAGGGAESALEEELRVAASDEAQLERSQTPETLGRVAPIGDRRGVSPGDVSPHPSVTALQAAQDKAAAADEAAGES